MVKLKSGYPEVVDSAARARRWIPNASGTAGGEPARMDAKDPSRRLERLEEWVTAETVRKVWQIVYVDSDGSRRKGETIEWQTPRSVQGRVPSFRKRTDNLKSSGTSGRGSTQSSFASLREGVTCNSGSPRISLRCGRRTEKSVHCAVWTDSGKDEVLSERHAVSRRTCCLESPDRYFSSFSRTDGPCRRSYVFVSSGSQRFSSSAAVRSPSANAISR
jgi:hypothetical protein